MHVPFYLASTLNSINYAATAPQKHRVEVYEELAGDKRKTAQVAELAALGFIAPLGNGRSFALTPEGRESLTDYNRTKAVIDAGEAAEERRTGWGIY